MQPFRILEQYLAKVAGHARNRLALSAHQKAAVDEQWGGLIREKGYDWASTALELTKSA
jgi:hypothetical protein